MINGRIILKETVGAMVFEEFEKQINRPNFDLQEKVRNIELAADVVEENPFVMMPLKNNGIITSKSDEAGLLRAFQPNIWAQDYAHSIGKLSKMTVETAPERANAAVEYLFVNSPHVVAVAKKHGEDTFRQGMQKAALIEAAYYERLGGTHMDDNVSRKIDVALVTRSAKTIHALGKTFEEAGISITDKQAVYEISQELELTQIFQELVRIDPYFKRRASQLVDFGKINSDRSLKLDAAKGDTFVQLLVQRLAKKHPALLKRVTSKLT